MDAYEYDPILKQIKIENIKELDNQNFHETAGTILQLSSLYPLVSPMRSVMFAVHASQAPLTRHHEPSRIHSGMERKYAETVRNIRAPSNCKVIKTIPKYTKNYGSSFGVDVKDQPRFITLVVDEEKKQEEGIVYLDCITIEAIRKTHQTYGWRPEIGKLPNKGDYIAKDKVIAESPRVTEDGLYMYGMNLKTAVMSINEITEDGFVLSETAAREKLCASAFTTITIPIGKFLNGDVQIPLNIYGDDKEYKIIPSIGDTIREDGLVCATRLLDKNYGCLNTSYKKLREVDLTHDRKFYLPASFCGGKVVDISISKADIDFLAPLFTKQIKSIYDAQITSLKDLYNTYKSMKIRNKDLKLSPELSIEITQAMKELGEQFQSKAIKSRKKNPQSDWTIDITIESDVPASISCKMAGKYGNKGVVVDIWPDEKMPIDKHGNRAEFIVDGDSVGKRMNKAVLDEQYIHAQLDQCQRNILKMDNLEDQAEELFDFYKACSPLHHMELVDLLKAGKVTKREIVEEFIRVADVYIPPYCPKLGVECIDALEKRDPLDYGTVWYQPEGLDAPVETEEKIIIADMYVMYSEKNGTEWSSVSSPNRNHFGLITKISSHTKNQEPFRENPMKFLGEPEVKAIASNCGNNMIGRVVSRANDPIATQVLHRGIMDAEQPSNVDEYIDYTRVKTNGSRANQFISSILFCNGIEITRDKK